METTDILEKSLLQREKVAGVQVILTTNTDNDNRLFIQ